MGGPRLVLAHVVRVGFVVNGTEHQARLVTWGGGGRATQSCRETSSLQMSSPVGHLSGLDP